MNARFVLACVAALVVLAISQLPEADAHMTSNPHYHSTPYMGKYWY